MGNIQKRRIALHVVTVLSAVTGGEESVLGSPKTKCLKEDMQTIKLTKELIEACEGPAQSYTWETIRLLAGENVFCADGQPIKGWKDSSIGRIIPVADYERAKLGLRKSKVRREKLQANQISLF